MLRLARTSLRLQTPTLKSGTSIGKSHVRAFSSLPHPTKKMADDNVKQAAHTTDAQNILFMTSESLEGKAEVVRGYNFDEGVNYEKLFQQYCKMGFQASHLGEAIHEVNRMRKWRLSDEPIPADEQDEQRLDPNYRASVKATIFLGYTSNLISSGVRETLRFLAQHKMIDAIVTTAGGVEEDFIKCLGNTYMGDFALDGADLRRRGLNRVGNMLVPNDNYCKFEDWIRPVLDDMLVEQQQGTVWSPSKMIHRLGKEINNEDSVYYWCYKNDIPVFSPAITDGSIGDMIYFHSYRGEGIILDLVQDIRKINDMAIHAQQSGAIILGGGLIKHHILNANLMRNGLDYCVFVNTGNEFDGSDAGARPDEAVSWGKLKLNSKAVKVYTEATIVFPIIVAETFAKDFHRDKSRSG